MKYQAHHYVTIVYDFEVEADNAEDAEDRAVELMETDGPWISRPDLPGFARPDGVLDAKLSEAISRFGWQYADLDDSTTIEPDPIPEPRS